MSATRQGERTGRMPPGSSYLGDVGTALRRSFSNAWMMTFTDLVALMLTFFVLLFSMSSVEIYKWQNLVRSLAGDLDSIQARQEAKPAVEFQIEQDFPPPAADLDYLTPVIQQQLSSEPELSVGVVWRAPGRTVISFPAKALFDGTSGTTAPRAQPVVYALSRLIQTLGNLIEVHGHSAPAGPKVGEAGGWQSSLARARALAEGMIQVGYDGPMVARGFGGSRHAAPQSGSAPGLGERVDIVIYEVAPHAP